MPFTLQGSEPDEVWLFDYHKRDVRSTIVHGKNDRGAGASPFEFVFPRGPLVKLYLAHIYSGQKRLTQLQGDRMIRMFVTKQGKAFTNVTFSQFWTGLQESTDTSGMAHFCASRARTTFVEDYTSANGVEPDLWDGAACLMGNTVRQWTASYRPMRRQHIAQRSVDAHAEYCNRRMEEDLASNIPYREVEEVQ